MRFMLVMAFVLGSCGGGKKTVADPGDESGDEGGDESGGSGSAVEEGEFCPPETYEEIESLFQAKSRVVNRCYVNAQERGEVAKGKAGVISLQMKISATGQARDIEVTNDTLECTELCKCVVDLVGGWDFPSCGVDVEYAYAYHFAP